MENLTSNKEKTFTKDELLSLTTNQEIYTIFKKYKVFGDFIKTNKPFPILSKAQFIDYFYSFGRYQIADGLNHLIINLKDLNNSSDQLYKILIATRLLSLKRNYKHFLQIYCDEKLKDYEKMPTPMAYGIKYGIITTIIGIILFWLSLIIIDLPHVAFMLLIFFILSVNYLKINLL